jgi:steroid delta-isomerase-like uncharacterized protein
MTRDDIAAVFAEREKLWNSHDVAAFAAHHSERGEVTSPIFGTVHGRDAIEKSYRNLFKTFVDWDFRGEDPVIDGQRAAQGFTVHMTHAAEIFGVPSSGRRLEIHGVLLFEFDADGKIARERRVYDFTGMLIQAGVLKAKP